jgi:hypothetical protein
MSGHGRSFMTDLLSFCEPAQCAWMETSTLAPQRPAAASHSEARTDPAALAHRAQRLGLSRMTLSLPV